MKNIYVVCVSCISFYDVFKVRLSCRMARDGAATVFRLSRVARALCRTSSIPDFCLHTVKILVSM